MRLALVAMILTMAGLPASPSLAQAKRLFCHCRVDPEELKSLWEEWGQLHG